MTKEKVTNYVIDLCSEMLVLNKDAIKLNSDIAEDLGADDLDFVEIIMNCESEFNVTIPESDAATVHTVDDLINVVCKNLKL